MDTLKINIEVTQLGTTNSEQADAIGNLRHLCKTLHYASMSGVELDVTVTDTALSSFIGNKVVLGSDFVEVMTLHRATWQTDPDMGDVAKLSYSGVIACNNVIKQLMPDISYGMFKIEYTKDKALYNIITQGGLNNGRPGASTPEG